MGIAGQHPIAIDDQADHAEAGPAAANEGNGQGLPDFACCPIDEDQVAHVLDHEDLALLGESQIDGAARKSHLLAGGFQDLVGRHDDPAIRLDTDLKPVQVIRGPQMRRGDRAKKQAGEAKGKWQLTHSWLSFM